MVKIRLYWCCSSYAMSKIIVDNGLEDLWRRERFSSATKTSFFVKNTKNKHSSASDWWECTKYRLKENAKILSKNSTTQKDITISRKNLLFFIKNTKINLFNKSLVGKPQI